MQMSATQITPITIIQQFCCPLVRCERAVSLALNTSVFSRMIAPHFRAGLVICSRFLIVYKSAVRIVKNSRPVDLLLQSDAILMLKTILVLSLQHAFPIFPILLILNFLFLQNLRFVGGIVLRCPFLDDFFILQIISSLKSYVLFGIFFAPLNIHQSADAFIAFRIATGILLTNLFFISISILLPTRVDPHSVFLTVTLPTFFANRLEAVSGSCQVRKARLDDEMLSLITPFHLSILPRITGRQEGKYGCA